MTRVTHNVVVLVYLFLESDLDWPFLLVDNGFLGIHFEQDILWLEVGVRQADLFMHESNSLQDLSGDALDLLELEAVVLVALDEFKQRLAQGFEHQTGVLVSVLVVHEVLVQQHQIVFVTSFVAKVFKDLYLNLGALVVPFDCSDDFDGVVVVVFDVLALQGSAESTVT